MRNLNDLATEVSRRADTAGLHVSAAEVKRVLSTTFTVLAQQPASVVLGLLSKWLTKKVR